MFDLNEVHLAGRLVADPVVNSIGENNDVTHFTLAYNYKVKDKPKADFYRVSAFGDTGKFIAEKCRKGTALLIIGNLSYREWTDDEGKKKSEVTLIAKRAQFIEPAKTDDAPVDSPAEAE